MPEEWLDIVVVNDKYVLHGYVVGNASVEWKLTPEQTKALEALQFEGEMKMQKLLRSFVG